MSINISRSKSDIDDLVKNIRQQHTITKLNTKIISNTSNDIISEEEDEYNAEIDVQVLFEHGTVSLQSVHGASPATNADHPVAS